MIEKLLDFCRQHHLPIDFCSWHHYGNNPHAIADEARNLRKTLDDNGFPACQSILDEWHYVPPGMDWKTIMTGVHYARKQQLMPEK